MKTVDVGGVGDKPIPNLTRKEIIALLLWNTGGNGFGLCIVANQMLWALDEPGPGKPDFPSIVALNGSPGDYSDEELRKIAAFAQLATAQYDRYFRIRRGGNIIIFDKPRHPRGMWLRKRLSWDMGPMHSPSLDEAIKFMTEAVIR